MAVQRLAMKEASPLYRKLSEEEKARYVQLAEGTSLLPNAIIHALLSSVAGS